MMFTFNKAKGLATGKSSSRTTASDGEGRARAGGREGCRDRAAGGLHRVAPRRTDGTKTRWTRRQPLDQMGVDIGPSRSKLFASKKDAGTSWNGPMGVFEVEAFAAGTMGVAKALSVLKDKGAPRSWAVGTRSQPCSRAAWTEVQPRVHGRRRVARALEAGDLPGVDASRTRAAATAGASPAASWRQLEDAQDTAEAGALSLAGFVALRAADQRRRSARVAMSCRSRRWHSGRSAEEQRSASGAQNMHARRGVHGEVAGAMLARQRLPPL